MNASPRKSWLAGYGINMILAISMVLAGLTGIVRAQGQPSVDFTVAIERVAEKVGPTVVTIRTETLNRYQVQRGYAGDPFYDDFFREFFGDVYGGYPEYERKSQGLGSGVIVDPAGYILTNEHVVRGADRITVNLADGRNFEGTLMGTDNHSDLAVVKINAPDLPVSPLGDSEQLKIGQWVVAVGNPFGHILDDPEPTVTVGVISALHRSLPVTTRRDTDYSDLIQTDAAINPGNSGGPLVNLQGEVIGINVAIFSTSGGYQGIGFAVPIHYAKAIVDQLIKGQMTESGWLGVGIQDLDQRLAQYFGLKTTDGILVNRVLENSPAQQAGLKDGDVILAVSGVKMRNALALIKYIGTSEPGKKITLTVLRDKKESNFPVMIGKRPAVEIPPEPKPENGKGQIQEQTWRGLKVMDVPPQLAQTLNLGQVNGVLVTDILADSAGQDAGLRPNDIIIAVNNRAVHDLKAFDAATRDLKGSCLLRTLRGHFVIEE